MNQTVEVITFAAHNFRNEGDPRACYYYPFRNKYYELLAQGVLWPGLPLPGVVDISFIRNNTLLPTSFDLRNPDRQPIGDFNFPGKSATITFTYNINTACGAVFDRHGRRTDYLYIVDNKALEAIGFHTFYTPRSNNPLHVRIVHQSHLDNPHQWNTPYKARVDLVALLQDHKVAPKDVVKLHVA